jgi:small subunit ribosomal protein S4
MARNIGPKCRLCRREGMKLFLKGERCHTVKCAIAKRGDNYPPGGRMTKRGRGSEYGAQLREKQRLKRMYGMLERQFRLAFSRAQMKRGNTGAALLQVVERRLDNVVRQGGFGLGPASARQIVVHGMVQVNGRKVDRPSFPCAPATSSRSPPARSRASSSRKSWKRPKPSSSRRAGSSGTTRLSR